MPPYCLTAKWVAMNVAHIVFTATGIVPRVHVHGPMGEASCEFETSANSPSVSLAYNFDSNMSIENAHEYLTQEAFRQIPDVWEAQVDAELELQIGRYSYSRGVAAYWTYDRCHL